MIDRLLPAESLRPTWSTATALVYIGGFVVLIATAALLGILEGLHGETALVGYSALAAAAAVGLAFVLQERERPVAAGLLVTLGVVFLGVFVAALLNVVGVVDLDDDGYQPGTHVIEIAIVFAALLALRRFRAPLLVLVVALTFWVTVGDIGSSAFSWSETEETLSLLVGALLAAAGVAVDRSGRSPFGLWLHVLGGVVFGGAVLALVSGDAGWLLVGALSLLYVAAAYWLERSSYAVLGAIGLLATTTYFAFDSFSFIGAFLPFGPGPAEQGLEPWHIALWFVAAGLVIGLLGLAGGRIAALRRG